jgi:microcystin-dependent protein
VTDQFLAEVRIVGFNFPPSGWASCEGQLMPISQNTALFSLLGTFYGGDGKSTFALPNIQDSAVVGSGAGPGLSQRFLGEQSGSQFITLLQSEMPAHTHNVLAQAVPATLGTGTATSTFARSVGGNAYVGVAANTTLSPNAIGIAGGSLPHNNMMPSLTLQYVIAMQGVYPPRQ